MHDLDVATLTNIREGITAKHQVLLQQPEDLQQLKGVLHVINAIRCAAYPSHVCTAVKQHKMLSECLYGHR